jgi:arylsulfatase A
VMQLIQELGLDEKTIFIFSSDNGPLYDRLGGTDCDFFHSAGHFRGHKGSMYEGGVRVPCLVRWKGKIAPGGTNDRVTGFEDWFPTLLDLIGAADQTPRDIDGISFAPTLFGKPQDPRPFLYRESPGYTGQQFVRVGNWKAVRQRLNPGPKAQLNPGPLELFDLAQDPSETKDVAADHSEVVARMAKLLVEQHVKSDLFPLRAIDAATP